MKLHKVLLGSSLVLAAAAAVPPAFAASLPRATHHRSHVRVERVSTRLSATLTNLSGAAEGGTQQQVNVTLEPSLASATYKVGKVTVSETTSACNPPSSFTVPGSNSTPGSYVVPSALEIAISFSPPCGSEMTIAYTGGSYRQGDVTYQFSPDSWTIEPDESLSPETVTQP